VVIRLHLYSLLFVSESFLLTPVLVTLRYCSLSCWHNNIYLKHKPSSPTSNCGHLYQLSEFQKHYKCNIFVTALMHRINATEFLLTYSLTHSHTHSLTHSTHTAIPEKLTSLQLLKIFLASYRTRTFITSIKRARHLSLSWASPIQSIPHTRRPENPY
jgi:hypothetical protein